MNDYPHWWLCVDTSRLRVDACPTLPLFFALFLLVSTPTLFISLHNRKQINCDKKCQWNLFLSVRNFKSRASLIGPNPLLPSRSPLRPFSLPFPIGCQIKPVNKREKLVIALFCLDIRTYIKCHSVFICFDFGYCRFDFKVRTRPQRVGIINWSRPWEPWREHKHFLAVFYYCWELQLSVYLSSTKGYTISCWGLF